MFSGCETSAGPKPYGGTPIRPTNAGSPGCCWEIDGRTSACGVPRDAQLGDEGLRIQP